MYINDEITVADNAFIAPDVAMVGKVTIGKDSSVWYKSVLRGDVDEIIIGDRSNVQDGTIIHCIEGYPTILGDDVSLGHGVVLHGCKLGNNILVGMRATILNGAVIGDNCLIAAGALVSEGMIVPPNSLVMGLPAKIKGQLNEGQLELIKYTSSNYVEYTKQYIKKYEK
ncbi:MAG: gamma carbonic anhydrase family protein [Candidatus Sericytochromatia bacterium]